MTGTTHQPRGWNASGGAISEQLFRAWQAGDTAACEEIWVIFHARIYTMAVGYCQRIGNRAFGEDAAATGFAHTWQELEREPAPGKLRIAWMGGTSLEAYVKRRVLLRCRDALRAQRRGWLERLIAAQNSDDDNLLERLGATRATQEDLVRGEVLKSVIREVAAYGEACRERKKLLEVVGAIQEFIRLRLIEAGSASAGGLPGGQSWESLALDDLCELVNPDAVEMTRSDMYAFLRTSLGLEPNVLYLRMREIAKVDLG